MSEDSVNSFEQGKSSACEFTSNSLEPYAESIASCSKSMECNFSHSDVEKQIGIMQTGQEENEMILNGKFETLINTCDEDGEVLKHEIVNVQYLSDTSDEDEVDHRGTGQTRNVMVLDDQFESCSKSGEYIISDEDEQINNISTEQEGNEIVVLDELDEKCAENLPSGWKKITQASGIPIYFHEETKTCCLAKPFHVGTQSLKNHNIPIENKPYLYYKLKLEKNNSQKDDDDLKKQMAAFKEYCNKLFKFKEFKVMEFSSYVVAVPVNPPNLENTAQPDTGEWIHLNDKTYISVLHGYVQRVLKTKISYTFKELENTRYPYMATVVLDGIQYGIGIGSSKSQAKLDSARASLEILLPSAKVKIKINLNCGLSVTQVNSINSSNFYNGDVIFDQLKIRDPRIPTFCSQVAELMPDDILQICVQRNFGEDAYIKTAQCTMQSSSDPENCYTLTMKVKNQMATVICKNKLDGWQKGAQALLEILHPHIKYYGSLLRLYSHNNFGSSSRKKTDEP